MPYGLIYKITNKINGKIYVGQTTRTLDARWSQHLYDATVREYPYAIYRAIRKYGVDAFTIESICECETLEELNEQEKLFAQSLNAFVPNGYTLTAGTGIGADSDDTKLKKSRAGKGRQFSETHKKNLSEAKKGTKTGQDNPFYGKTHTEETKKKLSEIAKHRTFSRETRKKMSESHKGKTPSQETLDKKSLAMSGEKNPMYGRRGKNSPHYGKKHSKEHRDKLAESQSKTFYFINPHGEEIIIKNLAKFCRENLELSLACMQKVAVGKNKTHKGWQLKV